MDSSTNPEPSLQVPLMNIPTRVCQTCGIAKSLDHFVSMYTEASTSNCDICRQHQREVYRCRFWFIWWEIVKQLKKKKLNMARYHTIQLRSSSKAKNHEEISPSVVSSSPISASPSIKPLEKSYVPPLSSTLQANNALLCVPSQRWIPSCVDFSASSVYIARLVNSYPFVGISE